jgi:hypothetical protein
MADSPTSFTTVPQTLFNRTNHGVEDVAKVDGNKESSSGLGADDQLKTLKDEVSSCSLR